MTGISSLISVSRMVTVAVLVSDWVSVASTVKTYRFITSRSSTLESRTTRLSVVVPKMVDMGRDPGVAVSGVATWTVKLPASKNHHQLTPLSYPLEDMYQQMLPRKRGMQSCLREFAFCSYKSLFFPRQFCCSMFMVSYFDWSNHACIHAPPPPSSCLNTSRVYNKKTIFQLTMCTHFYKNNHQLTDLHQWWRGYQSLWYH